MQNIILKLLIYGEMNQECRNSISILFLDSISIYDIKGNNKNRKFSRKICGTWNILTEILYGTLHAMSNLTARLDSISFSQIWQY